MPLDTPPPPKAAPAPGLEMDLGVARTIPIDPRTGPDAALLNVAYQIVTGTYKRPAAPPADALTPTAQPMLFLVSGRGTQIPSRSPLGDCRARLTRTWTWLSRLPKIEPPRLQDFKERAPQVEKRFLGSLNASRLFLSDVKQRHCCDAEP